MAGSRAQVRSRGVQSNTEDYLEGALSFISLLKMAIRMEEFSSQRDFYLIIAVLCSVHTVRIGGNPQSTLYSVFPP